VTPATVGGALGAGLETDEAAHEAACTYRSDRPPPGQDDGNGAESAA
jgi:hypothetical protein